MLSRLGTVNTLYLDGLLCDDNRAGWLTTDAKQLATCDSIVPFDTMGYVRSVPQRKLCPHHFTAHQDVRQSWLARAPQPTTFPQLGTRLFARSI